MEKVAQTLAKEKPKWLQIDDPSKLTNSFEFGPAWWIHFPMKVFGLLWSIRLRNFGFFEASNPGLENGGLFDYSKNESLHKFRKINIPKTIVTDYPYSIFEIESKIDEAGMSYPLVAKPDFGERGREVEFIENKMALVAYFTTKKQGRYLVQEYLGGGLEFGVFYTKNPLTNKANISSLTLKIPLQVIGDGYSDVKSLTLSHPRASRYLHEINYPSMHEVPAKNRIVKLSQKGNHCKGAVFLDCTGHVDDEMVVAFEQVCAPYEDFFYGRLDVKVPYWENLWQDQKVKIIEVNGCNSEPIHIYSPGNSYFNALKVVWEHFAVMAGIAKFNLKKKNYQPNLSNLWANYLNFRKSRKV